MLVICYFSRIYMVMYNITKTLCGIKWASYTFIAYTHFKHIKCNTWQLLFTEKLHFVNS